MATDYDIALRMQLHYLPTHFPAKARRAAPGRAWLECASVRSSDRSLVLRFAHAASPLYVEILVDTLSGLVYTEAPNPAVAALCETINAAAVSRGAARLLTALLATVAKEVQTAADRIWAPAGSPKAWTPSQRAPIESCVAELFGGLSRHPALLSAGAGGMSTTSPRARGFAVADGLGQQVSFIVCALHNIRRLLVCKPLPHWIMLGGRGGMASTAPGAVASSTSSSTSSSFSSTASAGDVSSPHGASAAVDFDSASLDRSIAGLGSLRALVGEDGRVLPHALAHLPLEALLLLYFLLALAPVRLLRLPAPTVEGADSSFLVLHGACVPAWQEAQAASAGAGAGVGAVGDAAAPLWETQTAQRHGLYREGAPGGTSPRAGSTAGVGAGGAATSPRVRWFHGTATDNVHAAVSFGLRSLSGTRHQASGDMYGEGVYVTNALPVALNFARVSGVAWAGYSTALGAATTHAHGGVVEGGRVDDGSFGGGQLVYASSEGGDRGSLMAAAAAAASAPRRALTKPSTVRAVLELDLIAAPGNKIMVDGREIVGAGVTAPLPPACYAVVPDACLLWMRALHVFDDEDVAVVAPPQVVAAAPAPAGVGGSPRGTTAAAAAVGVVAAAAQLPSSSPSGAAGSEGGVRRRLPHAGGRFGEDELDDPTLADEGARRSTPTTTPGRRSTSTTTTTTTLLLLLLLLVVLAAAVSHPTTAAWLRARARDAGITTVPF
jgi:hypothetical protein